MSRIPILETIVHQADAHYDETTGTHTVGLTGLCAGYERRRWRGKQLAADMVRTHIAAFALRHSELTDVGHTEWARLLERAARAVYRTPKFRQRGEFGELLLHAALVDALYTTPAISKIYFKDGPNETVKGFDAVHVAAAADGELELWLGEAKFYDDIKAAIREAVTSLAVHERPDYLRDEYAAILNKVDDAWPHADALRRLLDPNTSLDDVFKRVCVPVLLTYDSPTVAAHARSDAAYRAAICDEWAEHHADLAGRKLPADVKIHLILVPLRAKATFVKALNEALRKWQ